MLLPPFFYSKKFYMIMTVIIGAELLLILGLKIYGSFCEEPGCWKQKDWGTQYCMEHINSHYEESKKRSSGNLNGEREYHSFEAYTKNGKNHSTVKKKSTPSYSSKKYKNNSSSYSSWKSDPYDVKNYDDPDDFADDWAEEFGDGDYDGGYDDAYDYWEEEYGN